MPTSARITSSRQGVATRRSQSSQFANHHQSMTTTATPKSELMETEPTLTQAALAQSAANSDMEQQQQQKDLQRPSSLMFGVNGPGVTINTPSNGFTPFGVFNTPLGQSTGNISS